MKWTILLGTLAGVCVADLWVKRILRERLSGSIIGLGPLGCLRVVDARMWLARSLRSRLAMWLIWTSAALFLALVTFYLSVNAWCAGLLLGGSLSHALETSKHGRVTDYVCLRFWPAFNVADVAITIGAIGLICELIARVM